MTNADWYFDFISPYSYFAWLRLDSLPEVQLHYRPILFAGLLNHWQQKGPAEIAGKREWTYRWCTWWAKQQNIAFRFPAAHPFNPIPYLRLALAANCSRAAIDAIFKALWTTGANAGDPQLPIGLAHNLGIDAARLNEQSIKDMLRQNTDAAIAHGVFGVPTLRVREQLFWGADALDFARDFLADPALFDTVEMRRVGSLPIGVARKLN